jgi:hypothetical protein
MNVRSEKKLLQEFLKIVDAPDKAEKKFMRYTKAALLASALLSLFCLSDTMDPIEHTYYFILCAFISGTAFGLGIWFLQASTQTGIMVQHISKESVHKRIDEITRNNPDLQDN